MLCVGTLLLNLQRTLLQTLKTELCVFVRASSLISRLKHPLYSGFCVVRSF